VIHSIYLITCGNGKQYCGYTSRDPLIRLQEHKKAAECGVETKFYSTVRKHSITKFEVLHEFKYEGAALAKEIQVIHEMNLVEEGLNTDPGGHGRTLRLHKVDNGDGTYTFTVEKLKRKPSGRLRHNILKRRRYSSRRRQNRRR